MEIFKSVKTEASKEFEKLLDTQFSKTQSLVEGKIIDGVVTKITEKFVFLDCGLKSEPILDVNELKTIGLEKKIIVGENQAIKNICSWKGSKKKQINKSDLIKYDSELAKKYISIGKAVIKFKVNDFRPYTF